MPSTKKDKQVTRTEKKGERSIKVEKAEKAEKVEKVEKKFAQTKVEKPLNDGLNQLIATVSRRLDESAQCSQLDDLTKNYVKNKNDISQIKLSVKKLSDQYGDYDVTSGKILRDSVAELIDSATYDRLIGELSEVTDRMYSHDNIELALKQHYQLVQSIKSCKQFLESKKFTIIDCDNAGTVNPSGKTGTVNLSGKTSSSSSKMVSSEMPVICAETSDDQSTESDD